MVRRRYKAHLLTGELTEECAKLRKVNAELTLAKSHSEEASRAKSAFLANMSHELRAPLNTILGLSEIIRDKLFGDAVNRYANYAGDIHQSGTHLLNIITDILDISKIEAGKLELREEKVEVHAVVHESLILVAQQAKAGGVRLSALTSDIDASIFGDRTKLMQIIVNLLSNAIKFTLPKGAVALAMAHNDDGGLTLTIRDTGIGMSRKEIGVALKVFRQVDSSLTRRLAGAGLGLPLAVQLTELHGGALTIRSKPGLGTTVVVRLPAERITWDKGRAAKRAQANPAIALKPAHDRASLGRWTDASETQSKWRT